MRDAYLRFLDRFKIGHEEFFRHGLDDIIHVPLDVARRDWDALKDRVTTGGRVFIRSYGAGRKNSHQFISFYSQVFAHNQIEVDPTNNSEPQKLLARWTGFSRRRGGNLRNYQVSHVFGRTKNAYAFTAPWNIVYVPKVIDPFTGHEAKGELPQHFRRLFERHVFELYEPLIKEFNALVVDAGLGTRIAEYAQQFDDGTVTNAKFIADLRAQFAPIELDVVNAIQSD
jgi:hypothetical protein